MKKNEKIVMDDRSLKSIKLAERRKTILENKGYTLIKTRQVGLEKFELTYKR
jgi:hypothetical protein